MRTLNRNKTKLWAVDIVSYTDEVDDAGDFTGESVPVYGSPSIVFLPLYPVTAEVSESLFGRNNSLDIACVSTIELSENTLLFLTEPAVDADFDILYDYRVSKILPSLNSYQYGLSRRL